MLLCRRFRRFGFSKLYPNPERYLSRILSWNCFDRSSFKFSGTLWVPPGAGVLTLRSCDTSTTQGSTPFGSSSHFRRKLNQTEFDRFHRDGGEYFCMHNFPSLYLWMIWQTRKRFSQQFCYVNFWCRFHGINSQRSRFQFQGATPLSVEKVKVGVNTYAPHFSPIIRLLSRQC